jgi:branched-chain amino acid transport system ATP-binding protein
VTAPRTRARTDEPATLALVDVVAGYFPDQHILNDLTLNPPAGELSVIIGPNGSGKSTALRVLAGLLRPSVGRVLLGSGPNDTDVSAIPAHARTGLGIAYLPQGHSVFPAMSVHDNLVLGGWCMRRSRTALRAAVAQAYDRYPALAAKRSAPAGSLSGGQQRILELARALISDPGILLIDEPSAGVAPDVAAVMYRELAQLRDEGRTVVLVDQDVRAALAIADTVYVLKSGSLDRSGPAAAIGADLDTLVQDWLSIGAVNEAHHTEEAL